MSFISGGAGNLPRPILRRIFNWLLPAPSSNPPGPDFPAQVFFAYQGTPTFPVSGAPVDEQSAFLSLLSSYGCVNFEGFGGFGGLQDFTIPMKFLADTIFIESAPIGAFMKLEDETILGRYNTTTPFFGEPVNRVYLSQDIAGGEIETYKFTPSAPFDAFGLYITDPGDFEPANYVFTVETTDGTYLPEFDLAEFVPTPSGCLVFWGFVLNSGRKIVSVTLTIPNTLDVIGLDDILVGNR